MSADLVIRHLKGARRSYARLNTDSLGRVNCFIGYGSEPELNLAHRIIRASDISAVWARRFALPTILDDIQPKYSAFVKRELTTVLDAFIEGADSAIRINSSWADRIAGNRLLQAQRAKRVGFTVPSTLVTQDEKTAREFLSSHKNVISKAISFGQLSAESNNEEVSFTTPVPQNPQFDGLKFCPNLFQEQIAKRFDWRVTTVGNRVFSARTKSFNSGQPDWRQRPSASGDFVVARLPDEVEARLITLCEESKLVYGAHDLVETDDGDFVFLETNPAGQWGWLELSLGMPIGRAIADELMKGEH